MVQFNFHANFIGYFIFDIIAVDAYCLTYSAANPKLNYAIKQWKREICTISYTCANVGALVGIINTYIFMNIAISGVWISFHLI